MFIRLTSMSVDINFFQFIVFHFVAKIDEAIFARDQKSKIRSETQGTVFRKCIVG